MGGCVTKRQRKVEVEVSSVPKSLLPPAQSKPAGEGPSGPGERAARAWEGTAGLPQDLFTASTLYFDFCKGHRRHRCWPSGPVEGPSGESEEDAGITYLKDFGLSDLAE